MHIYITPYIRFDCVYVHFGIELQKKKNIMQTLSPHRFNAVVQASPLEKGLFFLFFLLKATIYISTEQERRSCAIEDVMQFFIPSKVFIS